MKIAFDETRVSPHEAQILRGLVAMIGGVYLELAARIDRINKRENTDDSMPLEALADLMNQEIPGLEMTLEDRP